MYSAIIFIVILFLSLTSYNYFINRIYLNDLLSVMSNIANGRYEKKSLDENKHKEIDTQLNMI